MLKKNVVYTQRNFFSLQQQQQQSYVICRKMDTPADNRSKWIKPVSGEKNQTFSPFVIPRFHIVIYDHVCIYDMNVKVKLSLGWEDYLESRKRRTEDGELCSTHNIYLYENFENNFFKKEFLLESSFQFSFPLNIHPWGMKHQEPWG